MEGIRISDEARALPPTVGAVRPFHLPPVSSDALPTGLGLRFMPKRTVPLVSGVLVLDAGEAGLEEARAGLAVLTGDALQGGTAERSGVELAERLEGLGTALRVSTGWDSTTVGFTCVAERLDAVVALLAEVARSPAFPADEVERVRRQRLASIQQRRMDPGDLADDEVDRVVFGPEHPFHRPLGGTAASVSSLGARDPGSFAAERYGPARGGFVAVGDLEFDRLRALVERHFGDWKGSPLEAPCASPAPLGPRRRIRIVSRPGAVQSEIRIGEVGPPRGTPDEEALQVANTILGGAFTSRLNLNLRERHGFTYGVHSYFSLRRGGGGFAIGTAVQTEVTAAALSETMREFRLFAEAGPAEDEVARARDYLAGVFPLRMETTAQLAGRLAELIVYALPDDHHHRYRERIRAVEVDGVRAAVEAHLHPDRAAIVLVGDAERIGPEVEALGLGAVEVIDP